MEILTTVVIVAIAMWAGWHLRGITLLARFSSDPEHFIKILEQIKKCNDEEQSEVKEKILGVEVSVEQVQGFWYAYATENNQFLGQGPTLEDALKMASDRFPNKKFWCKKPDEVSHST